MSILPKKIGQWIDKVFISSMKYLPLRHAQRFLYLLRTHPEIGDRWGYSIRPITYYEPIPDYRQLRPDPLERRRLNNSIDWQINEQQNLLKALQPFAPELKILDAQQKFDFDNSFYPKLDAAVYYAIVRYLQPGKVIEIGSGYSTQILHYAALKNPKRPEITCVEPYPESRLVEADIQFNLVAEQLENLDFSFFDQLEAGDILFIDSTHTIKFNSDVCQLVLQVLPRLKPGVWIHFHDIWFPFDYPYEWIFEERRSWGEQYFLEAFLAYNSDFKVRFVSNLMAVDFPTEMQVLWSKDINWDSKHRSACIWIERVQ